MTPASTPEARGATRALWIVSAAVFLASSTWFSGTAAAEPLSRAWQLDASEAALLTVSVQLGFVLGTLLYTLTNLSDVFNARRVFACSALAGAGCNAAFACLSQSLESAVAFRFMTGVTLAGVYPVGMKILASWYWSLGYGLGVMVGALTLGTAAPYLARALGRDFSWQLPALASTAAALAGAVLILALPDGPRLRARTRLDLGMGVKVFAHPPFRHAAFGYFGHMWELYAFWSLVGPYAQAAFAETGRTHWVTGVAWVSFATIAVGALGCVAGGYASRRVGERRVAMVALGLSGACCVASPWLYRLPPPALCLALLVWGVAVIADSPQFSSLSARHCPPAYTGTALTVQNGVGFAISTLTIALLPRLAEWVGFRFALAALALGPAAGLFSLARLGTLEAGQARRLYSPGRR